MKRQGVIKEIIDSWRNVSAKQLAKEVAKSWRDLLALFVASALTKPALDHFGWQDNIINYPAVFFSIVIVVAIIFVVIESIIKAIRHEQERTDRAD